MSENVSKVEVGQKIVGTGSETNVEIEVPVQCEVCKSADEVRIVLRQCGHVVCLPCILEYIKHRIILDGHPRFKCPTPGCLQIVHENDIAAVLDEKEPALEVYMPVAHRRYLQHKQHKHSITAALPSADVKRCPLCRAIYLREPGCNYVICANSACATAFCWSCEKPIGRPSSHFTTASTCRLGYTDYERLLRTVQMVLDVNFIVLWIFLPFVYLIALLYIPILILFLAPASIAYQNYRREVEGREFLLPVDVLTIVFKVLMGIVLGLFASFPLAIGSVISGLVIITVYVGFVFIRMIPCGLSGDRVNSVLCMMRWAGRLFRIGPYATLLSEAKKEREEAIVKLEQNQDDFGSSISSGIPTSNTSSASSNKETSTSVLENQKSISTQKTESNAEMLEEVQTEKAAEIELNSSRGWREAFDIVTELVDLTDAAHITLSSVSDRAGVDELLSDSVDAVWRTNEKIPHTAEILFSKKTEISFVAFYIDYDRDESYCPLVIKVELGWSTNNYWHKAIEVFDKPKGWVRIETLDDMENEPIKAMSIRVTVMKNHDGGKDCVFRHLRVIGPADHKYDPMNRLALGPTMEMPAEGIRQFKDAVLNNYHSFR